MSIAVSAVVKPSRLVLALVGTICIGSAGVGAAILFGQIGALPILSRMLAGAALGLAGGGGFYWYLKSRKTHHIDISGIGQIRIVEDSALAAMSTCNTSLSRENASDIVCLMEDSTLWPCLLLLRLKTRSQSVKVIFVLPDSVDQRAFKALSVACRWIAAHNDPAAIPEADNF